MTGSSTFPRGCVTPGLTPWKVPVGQRRPAGTWSCLNTRAERRLRPAPPSTSILVTLVLLIVGDTTSGKTPTPDVRSG